MNAIAASAAQAMTNAFARYESGAHKLLDGVSGGPSNPAEGVADMITAKVQVTAAAAVLRVFDEMNDRLLDIKA